jgi:hypothetical protein
VQDYKSRNVDYNDIINVGKTMKQKEETFTKKNIKLTLTFI